MTTECESLASLGSAQLTSICSRASPKIYGNLKPEIIHVEQSQADLDALVDAARKIINEKFVPDHRSILTCRKRSGVISIDLGAVLGAMLASAQGCGGESGKRYVASAIVAFGQKGGPGAMVETLAALGTTWFTHLLFACQWHYFVMNDPV